MNIGVLIVTQERVCGSCTACCKTHGVSEITKPIGRWCPHCQPGKGCSIYGDRPLQCQEFRCEWLKGLGNESDRPDRRKVVLDYVKHPEGPPSGILQIWEVTEGAINGKYVTEITHLVLLSDVWVSHISISGRRKMFLPRNTPITLELKILAQAEGFEFGFL